MSTPTSAPSPSAQTESARRAPAPLLLIRFLPLFLAERRGADRVSVGEAVTLAPCCGVRRGDDIDWVVSVLGSLPACLPLLPGPLNATEY